MADSSIQPDVLLDFIQKTLQGVGADKQTMQDTAQAIWLASLRGVDSHGVRLLPHYIAATERGRINPRPKYHYESPAPSVGLLDADHTYGHAAGFQGIRHAVELAKQTGVGMVSVKNSSHCGALAPYALAACEDHMIGFVTTHTSSLVKSTHATRTFFGSNPLCFAAPMSGEAPFCYDAAISAIPRNRLNMYKELNQPLPPLSVADEAGYETTDPQKAFQLLPIGDHKGYGLAMVVDILCGLLSGMAVGRDIVDTYKDPLDKKRRLGHLFMAVNIETFQDIDDFKNRLKEMADHIRSEPRRDPDVPVMVPGDPEKQKQAYREKHGIPIDDQTFEKLKGLDGKYQLGCLI